MRRNAINKKEQRRKTKKFKKLCKDTYETCKSNFTSQKWDKINQEINALIKTHESPEDGIRTLLKEISN